MHGGTQHAKIKKSYYRRGLKVNFSLINVYIFTALFVQKNVHENPAAAKIARLISQKLESFSQVKQNETQKMYSRLFPRTLRVKINLLN